MAWNNPNDTVIGGSGQVYVAPVGTALPTTPTGALNAAFTGLGYHTEEGVQTSAPLSVIEHKGWQSKAPIRREVDSRDFQLTFALLQWDEDTLPLAFGGGTIVSVSGGYRYDPPQNSDALDERALVCDVDDGSERIRFVIPRGSVTEGVDSTLNRSAMASLPVTFKALEPADGSKLWYPLFSDTTAFAPGS